MDLSKKERDRPKRSRWHFGPRWVELTVVFVATVVTGFVGGRASDVGSSSDRAEPAPTVTVTVTQTVTASPTPLSGSSSSPTRDGGSESPTGEPIDGGTGESPQPAEVYLADLDRVSDRGYVNTSPVTMRGTNYPKSIRIGCDTSSSDEAVYNVSGYKRLTATVGLPADTGNSIASVGSIKVFNASGNRMGEPVTVRSSAVGQLAVDITDQDQIKITCTLIRSGDPDRTSAVSGLGDATISMS
ncbi:hypothetical protein [Streptomyces apocyni]|uniref:hypothetical protein n=1 Tax=Streptomyces apocyni TaxID=2654677 RepID=UPI0012E9D729|nr:hypothetical protein [Streptomyces apocyni]